MEIVVQVCDEFGLTVSENKKKRCMPASHLPPVVFHMEVDGQRHNKQIESSRTLDESSINVQKYLRILSGGVLDAYQTYI